MARVRSSLAAMLAVCSAAQAQPARVKSALINRQDEIAAQFNSCWLVPGSQSGKSIMATARMSFRADGALLGQPLITYVNAPAGSAMRADIAASVKAALAACTPLPFTAALGSAIAGRMIVIRFISNPANPHKETPV